MSNSTHPGDYARRLAAESLAADDPTGWFERLYAAARKGETAVPWHQGEPHRALADWTSAHGVTGHGLCALVVGCGLGEDAEFLAELGYDTTAFDISATAVESARHRTPDSFVRYVVADLLSAPPLWTRAFDLVLESHTVQALPEPPRARAIAAVGNLVTTGGTLLVLASARSEGRPPVRRSQGPPWPLARAEVEAFATEGLVPVRVEALPGTGGTGGHAAAGTRTWRAEFRRVAG